VTRRELVFSAAGDAGQVFAALSSRYTVNAAPATSGSWTCLDTPDWLLHRAGLTLRDARSGRKAELVLGGADAGGDPLIEQARVRAWPASVAALPPCQLRERVAAAVGVRALVPMAQVDVRSIPMSILDADDKTLVRVRVDQQRLHGKGNQPLPLRVLITALRGYEDDAGRCAALLTASLPQLETSDATATIAMTVAGHEPGRETVPRIELDPTAPAAQSVARVLHRLIDVATTVVPGVMADIDPEYLHDLRTSLRATRSVLGQAGDVLPSAQVEAFGDEFQWLASLTSPVRDLDVLLLMLTGHDATQIGDLDALAPLTRYLTTRRTRVLRTLRDGLESARYGQLIANWRTTLAQAEVSGPATAPLTAPFIAELAQHAYHRIRTEAEGVTAQTAATELHQLRKHCKQMRYLLDGFATGYSPAPLRRTLKVLKRLQDSLGSIQDSTVQRAILTGAATALAGRGTGAETMLQIGALRDRIAECDAAGREDLVERLVAFCGKTGRANARALERRT
jgi:CHAD domain-containing protein